MFYAAAFGSRLWQGERVAFVSDAEVVLVATKLRDQKPSVGGMESSTNKEEDRREWALRGLSLSLACLVAGFVSLFVWGTEEDQGAIEAVLGASVEEGSLPSPEALEGFDPAALKERLEEIAAGHEGVYGIAVLESASETQISSRGDEQFMAASIGKLPVLATLYRAGTQGELDLQEEIPVLPEDIRDYGDGEIPDFPAEDFLSLRESAYRMINHSDNVAWSMLDRRLGAERIRGELERMDIRSSWYSDDLSGYFTTPNDVLLLLERISDPRFTSEEFSAEMLNAMTETHLEDRIPENLPLEVRVAHKTGTYEDNFGDAALVIYEDSRGVVKHYYLVVLVKGTGEDDARDVIQSISLAVYEALTGNKVDPGWSRGKLYSSVLEEETLDQEETTEPYLP